MEEQQLHLNVGLQKIRETVEQVEELQASLSIKKNDLEQKNSLANQKLKEMVQDQQEAEKRKITSQEIQEELIVSIHYYLYKYLISIFVLFFLDKNWRDFNKT